jgi:hypothetical protein
VTSQPGANRSRPKAAALVPVLLRIGWGGGLVVQPRVVLRLLGGVPQGSKPRRIMRILGARHLLQAAATWRFGRRAGQVGVVVDALHAATDVAFAGLDRRWRRAAATDAAITSTFAVLGLIDP